MQTRIDAPFYETALAAAICEANTSEAIKLIHCIASYQGNNTPSLTAVDQNGKNFLEYALEESQRAVAIALLESQKFNDQADILFKLGKDHQSLICLAASHGFTEIVIKLCQLCQNIDPDNKLWLKEDDNGNTPLHHASKLKINGLYRFLIDLIVQEVDASSYLNHMNQEGSAPLHIALLDQQTFCVDLVRRLINAGANLNLVSRGKVTPLGLLRRHKVAEQLELIHSLEPSSKKALLLLYNDYCYKHPADDKAREVYYKYQSSSSLKDLAIAQLELEADTIKKNFYISNPEKVFNSNFGKLQLSLFESRFFNDNSSKQAPQSAEAIFEQDLVELNQLIDSISTKINDWKNRRQLPWSKIAAIAAPTVITATWAGVTAYWSYLGMNEIKNQTVFYYHDQQVYGTDITNHPNETHIECHKSQMNYKPFLYDFKTTVTLPNNTQHNSTTSQWPAEHFVNKLEHYMIKPLNGTCTLERTEMYSSARPLIGTVSGIGCVLASFYAFKKFWYKSYIHMIDSKEWLATKSKLTTLSDKLADLKDEELPTNSNNIIELDSLIECLDTSKSRDETVEIFLDILETLKFIKLDMISNNKPFSRSLSQDLKRDSLDDSVELNQILIDDDSDDEATPFLRNLM